MASLSQPTTKGSTVATASATRSGWGKTMQNALIITQREVRDSFRDWRIVAPILILTFLFPFLAQFVAAQFAGFLAGYGAELIGERTIPFLLMIVGFFPISISLVIALETFVGEKERRSLEPLLSTPLSNTELYIGKTLAAMIPPLLASFGGMLVYLLTLLGGELAWRPPAMLIVQIFLLTIVQALVMVTGAVVVSSQTTSTRAANLLASFIVIPMALVINGESIIMFLAPDAESPQGIGALWAIIFGMLIVAILLLRVGNSIFNREELLGREIDTLNLVGAIRRVGTFIIAVNENGTPARNLLDWYRRSIPFTLRRMRVAIGLTVAVFALAFSAGFVTGQQPQWQLPLEGAQNVEIALQVFEGIEQQSLQTTALGFIIWQNGRVLLLTLLLSIFSFGVTAFIIPPVVYLLLGYLLSQMLNAGLQDLFFAATLPHAIAEIPMIILATAAIFRVGAIVTLPPGGQTVVQAWTQTFGETLKIGLGLVLPLMILAALLETYLTPAVVLSVLSG